MRVLHITNGDSLTSYLKELQIEGDYVTWREMLCEGSTVAGIDSDEFFEKRKTFLNRTYNIPESDYTFKEELEKLNTHENYSEIVLWFEYDLFCHINLMACISLLHQRNIKLPLSLVCSGRIKGETDLKGLGELSPEQLLAHYNSKIKLTQSDITLAIDLWRTYCGKDHNLFKDYITKQSSFTYLSNCLKAHLKRFPDSRTGLSTFEFNMIKLLNEEDIKSKHHLLGYALSHQGYYGYGDIQIQRLIDKISVFFEDNENGLSLNRKGHEVLHQQCNVTELVGNNLEYGGVKRYDFQFNKKENRIIKTITHAY